MLRLRLGRWHPVVRLARWYERRDARLVEANLCVSRGMAAFLESRFGVANARVLYDRPASVFVPHRAARARTVSPGAVRPSRRSAQRRRFHRLSDELDRGRRLRRGHRRRAPAGGSDARVGGGGAEPPVSRSGHPGHRRRRPPHAVRAPLRRSAGAACAVAHALARTGRISACRRQRRSRAVPAPLVIGARHPDEGRRPVRRRRAGVRARLRRLPGGARASRRQRHAVRDRPAAGRSPVRSVRGVSGRQAAMLERLRVGARRSAGPTWEQGWAREAKDVLLPGA